MNTINETLLEQAILRYENKNKIRDEHYKEDINSFILRLYLQCDPAGYGKVFVKKILRDNNGKNGINIYPMLDRGDKGDMAQTYPERHYFTGQFYDKRFPFTKELPFNKVITKYYEVKISYLGKNDTYTIRNIRPYQNFDYYILCFVNCKNKFKPSFIVVPKKEITENSIFTLTPMNGTKNANKDNKDIGYGTSLKRNHWKDLYLEGQNLLKGTSYEDLITYLSEQSLELEKTFNKTVKITSEDRRRIKEHNEVIYKSR